MLLIKNAELHAYMGTPIISDVRCQNGFIQKIQHYLSPQPGEQVIDANARALLPGLHDHHIHLYALAASQSSIHCGPPAIQNNSQLKQALQTAKGEWVRGIQYHESVAGELDRWKLDALIKNRPVRIQHRSGILWILNSRAIEILGLSNKKIEGLERNKQGDITGRLFRLDGWLRKQMGEHDIPNLNTISRQLAAYGVTGLTDTSANNDIESLRLFERAIEQGELLQNIILMGGSTLPNPQHAHIKRGAVKILLDEFKLPNTDNIKKIIQQAHYSHRPVAFHCVTETELIFALSLLKEAGTIKGDRIEHASICPDSALPLLQETGVSVVTQTGLLYARGEQYQHEVDKKYHPLLYRAKFFIKHNIPFALSSDAPYGPSNPWLIMQTATQRESTAGYVFGEQEKVSPEEALRTYLKNPMDLTQERSIAVGEKADLCLINMPWKPARTKMELIKAEYCIVNNEIINF